MSKNLTRLQNPTQINGDNLNSVRHETNVTFMSKNMEYLKNKINSMKQTVNKHFMNLYRGVNEF
jgi:hypothetical protein